MPQTGTQTCTDQQSERIFIAFSESSKRMPKAAAAADDRVDQGSLWRKQLRNLDEELFGQGAPTSLEKNKKNPVAIIAVAAYAFRGMKPSAEAAADARATSAAESEAAPPDAAPPVSREKRGKKIK